MTAPALPPIDAAERPIVEVRGVAKTYSGRHGESKALQDMSVRIADGEFVVLLGASGCGKTTLLRCLAGLETPDAGEIEIGGRRVYSSKDRIFVPPESRGVGMVFQSYALWPHMTVDANVAYPLEQQGMRRSEITERVRTALAMVGLEGRGRSYPGQLSGGQQQRVALARATASGSRLILFDEPLSNIDTQLRDRLRLDLISLHHDLRFAAVYVTHDQFEAMALADRIVLIDEGRVLQQGTPREIYDDPHSLTAASFTGATNRIRGHVLEIDGGTCVIDTVLGPVRGVRQADDGLATGDPVVACIRPDSLQFGPADGSEVPNRWPGVVEQVVFLGSQRMWIVKTDGAGLRLSGRGAPAEVRQEAHGVASAQPSVVFIYPDPNPPVEAPA